MVKVTAVRKGSIDSVRCILELASWEESKCRVPQQADNCCKCNRAEANLNKSKASQ